MKRFAVSGDEWYPVYSLLSEVQSDPNAGERVA
jgi:hypothetical protein